MFPEDAISQPGTSAVTISTSSLLSVMAPESSWISFLPSFSKKETSSLVQEPTTLAIAFISFPCFGPSTLKLAFAFFFNKESF